MRNEYTEQQAKEIAMIASKYGFTDIQYAVEISRGFRK